ncbi:MAG: PH domain-containing protein [Thermomicrobiales bacterium]
MAFCPDCGTQNDDNAQFCKSCGRELSDVADAKAAVEPPAGSQIDDEGRLLADDGLPIGEDLDGEPGGERILWKGRPTKFWSPIKSLTRRYKITNERVMIERGFIGRQTEEIDLYRVTDVSVKQNMFERVFGYGDIFIHTTDSSAPNYHFWNVTDPDRKKDMIRYAARAERQRRRVLLRDEV